MSLLTAGPVCSINGSLFKATFSVFSKRGFRSLFVKNTAIINLSHLQKFHDNKKIDLDTPVDLKLLQDKKIINKNIITDNSPLEAPKDPNNSTVFHLYNLIASRENSSKMEEKLKAGGYGWGHAKKELIEELVKSFSLQREKFNHYINHPQEIEDVLQKGALKAKKVADATLNRVRKNLGYNS